MGSTSQPNSLSEWLDWQTRQHFKSIDLTLERVRIVYERLAIARIAPHVITVAGTNGKGSSVALLESILRAAGYRVGCYTSPHILRYNERIVVNQQTISDESLCAIFARIEAARGEIALTYFEYGTLAAFLYFAEQSLDVAILEVGLGGRLDAVNLIDADVALITTIDLDHCEWLGNDRDSIAREKLGIARKGQPLIVAELNPPESIAEIVQRVQPQLYQAGQHFGYHLNNNTWQWWQGPHLRWTDLPKPALLGEHQLQNAAAVLCVLACSQTRLPVTQIAVEQGLREVRLAGRLQRVTENVWIDVAHNPQAMRALVPVLANVSGSWHIVFGVLADKDAKQMLEILEPLVVSWHLITPNNPRALNAEVLAAALPENSQHVAAVTISALPQALLAAQAAAQQTGGQVLVCGSFYTVAEALSVL
ncbi:MAG: bifunctional tetrahydrofolate synthase/dihydrofolate synthase [Gammaproteobacteria bacterium]|nr:bifunctional tetrahydrofolate synthase/dihydrofolate synthase [Gammaproteobacteria bacterium]